MSTYAIRVRAGSVQDLWAHAATLSVILAAQECRHVLSLPRATTRRYSVPMLGGYRVTVSCADSRGAVPDARCENGAASDVFGPCRGRRPGTGGSGFLCEASGPPVPVHSRQRRPPTDRDQESSSPQITPANSVFASWSPTGRNCVRWRCHSTPGTGPSLELRGEGQRGDYSSVTPAAEPVVSGVAGTRGGSGGLVPDVQPSHCCPALGATRGLAQQLGHVRPEHAVPG